MKYKVGEVVIMSHQNLTNWYGKKATILRFTGDLIWIKSDCFNSDELAFDKSWIRKLTKLEKALS